MSDNYKLISQNKKAFHNYNIEEKFEAGLVLAGTEVKSVRMGKVSIKESFIKVYKSEVFIYNMNIASYEKGNIFNKDPIRTRKLLLNKREINKLIGSQTKDGYTIVPLKVYIKGNYVKLEIALAKGKKLYDKRHDIAKKDANRRMLKAINIKNQ